MCWSGVGAVWSGVWQGREAWWDRVGDMWRRKGARTAVGWGIVRRRRGNEGGDGVGRGGLELISSGQVGGGLLSRGKRKSDQRQGRCPIQSWYSLPPKEIRDLSDDEDGTGREPGCVVLMPCATGVGVEEEGGVEEDSEIEALVNPPVNSTGSHPCGHPCGAGCVVC